MKKTTFYLTLLLVINYGISHSQVGIGTVIPADGSIFDIESTEKGLLIPRVNIADLQTIAPVTGGATESLLVYNTNAVTGKGFYFWKNNRWNLIRSLDSENRGLQYYSYKITTTISPDINLNTTRNWNPVSLNGLPASGLYTSPTLSFPSINDSEYFGAIIKIIGTYTVKNAGTFNFTSQSDDGARIYIDKVLVLNRWSDSGDNIGSGSIYLGKGKHKIEFWVYNNGGSFLYNFRWGTNPDGHTAGSLIQTNQFTVAY